MTEAVSTDRSQRRSDRRYRIGALLIGLGILGLWELLPTIGWVNPVILPRFSQVAEALVTLVNQPFFARHFLVTLNEIVIGFVIGTSLGLAIGVSLAVWPAA